MNRIWTLTIFALAATGCANIQSTAKPVAASVECRIVYDAGSTKTVLHIYRTDSWSSAKSSKGPALAGLVKKSDISRFDGIVNLLKDNKIQEFKKNCSAIVSVKFYATAGMRLAEKADTNSAKKEVNNLWKDLHKELQVQHNNVPFEAKTITGFEEGIFAWLAVSEEENSIDFGIVEMGGASSQIAFPCPNCQGAKKVYVGNSKNPMLFYGHSFLGLGGDELPLSLINKIPDECVYGKAKNPALCSGKLNTFLTPGITDPYNLPVKSSISVPTKIRPTFANWYLLGGPLFYMDKQNKSDVENCCKNEGGKVACHNTKSSCFMAIYKQDYLNALDVPHPKKSQGKVIQKAVEWTKGAAICAENDCLRELDLTKLCGWREKLECLPILP